MRETRQEEECMYIYSRAGRMEGKRLLRGWWYIIDYKRIDTKARTRRSVRQVVREDK